MSGIEPIELEALLWAWTNAMGRLPDRNTMTNAEIEEYQNNYCAILEQSIKKLTGLEPDAYLAQRS